MRQFVPLALVLVLAALHVTPAAANAFPTSLGCETYWTGPSVDNSIVDCLKHQDKANNWSAAFWIPAMPLAIAGMLVLTFPIALICRQCCNVCGGHTRQPGVCCALTSEWKLKSQEEKDLAYSPRDHACVKIPAFLVFVVSIGMIILLIRGSQEADDSAQLLESDYETTVLNSFSTGVATLQAALQNSSSPTGYLDGVDRTTFDPLNNTYYKLSGRLTTYDDDYKKWVTYSIRVGINVLGVIPFVFLLLLPLYASMDRCMRFWPCFTSILYFIWGVIFGLLGGLFLFLAVVSTAGAGEITLFDNSQPGIFLWYVVPLCQQDYVADFTTIRDYMTANETAEAATFCTALAINCSSSTTYNAASPSLTFFCASLTSANAASLCTSYDTAKAVLSGVVAKTSSPACTGCSFSDCEKSCSSGYSTSASQTLNYLTATEGYSIAATTMTSFASCDYLVGLGVESITRSLRTFRSATWMIGFGCFVSCVLFTWGIILMLKGQKVFYKRPSDANRADGQDNNDAEMDEGKGSEQRPF